MDIDSLSDIVFKPEDTTVVFSYKDGTERPYTCSEKQWQRLRDFLKGAGLISEV